MILFTCEIRCQICSVSRDQNHCEKPKRSRQYSARCTLWCVIGTLLENGTSGEPQAVEQVEFIAFTFTGSDCCRSVTVGTKVVQAVDQKSDTYHLATTKQNKKKIMTRNLNCHDPSLVWHTWLRTNQRRWDDEAYTDWLLFGGKFNQNLDNTVDGSTKVKLAQFWPLSLSGNACVTERGQSWTNVHERGEVCWLLKPKLI